MSVIQRYGFVGAVLAVLVVMGVLILSKSFTGPAVREAGGANPAGQGAAGGRPGGAGPGSAGSGSAGPGGAIPVRPATIATRDFSDVIEAIGTAQANESIIVASKVTDVVKQAYFESGRFVRKGDPLVELQSAEQAADLAQAEAALKEAESSLLRFQELFDKGLTPQARLDAATAARDRAAAQAAALESRLADRFIRAPFSGVVGLRSISPGALVRPGDPITTLDDVATIKLDFDLPEWALAKVRAGARIEALSTAYPGVRFDGAIGQMDTRVNPTTRTIRARAFLPNRDRRLKPGMLMTVRVASGARQAIAAPELALIDSGDQPYVFRIAQKEGRLTAERTTVRIGARFGGYVEILEGVKSGERVVLDGVNRVRPGGPVRIIEAAGPADGARPQAGAPSSQSGAPG